MKKERLDILLVEKGMFESREKAKKSIDALFAKIDELEQKSEKTSEKTKAKYNEAITDLKLMKSELQAKYKALEHSSEKDWEEKKAVFNSSMESFKEGFSKISQIFK